MRFLLIVVILLGVVACGGEAGPAAPSAKRVDSAVAAAPDTIKAIAVDSVKR